VLTYPTCSADLDDLQAQVMNTSLRTQGKPRWTRSERPPSNFIYFIYHIFSDYVDHAIKSSIQNKFFTFLNLLNPT